MSKHWTPTRKRTPKSKSFTRNIRLKELAKYRRPVNVTPN